MRSISEGCGISSTFGGISPTTGLTNMPLRAFCMGKSPINCTSNGFNAVSSCASRNATTILLVSCGSRLPPGKDTSPA